MIMMVNWDEIIARGIVRKTVALHPIWDQYVRITQASILEEGKDASYSLALNYMLLMAFNLVVNKGIDMETAKIMSSFLEDQKTVEDLNYENLTIEFEKALKDRFIKDNK